MPQEKTVLIEEARLIFRNFEGRETQYNRAGDRNFCVILPPSLVVDDLLADGWNVKFLKPREAEDIEQPYLKVTVGYKFKPPKIVLITSRGRNDVPEEMVEMLDWVDIAKVDLIIRPYNNTVRGETGVAAYLKTMYITVNEDALELKYGEFEDTLPARAGRVED